MNTIKDLYANLIASNKLQRIIIMIFMVSSLSVSLIRRIWKTPCCNKPYFKGTRLGAKSYSLTTYLIVLFLTIPELSWYFLQVFWLCSNSILKLRPIWSGHPVYVSFENVLWPGCLTGVGAYAVQCTRLW